MMWARFTQNYAFSEQGSCHKLSQAHHTSCRAAARKMVAGVKGVAFLDGDTMAVTSSTKGELFLVSKASQSVLRRVELDVKAESLCAVPGTRRVLVADGRGTLCCVDTATEPATVACVAGSAHHAGGAMRLTSVAAWDDRTCFAAGAVRGDKTRCSVRRVDLVKNEVAEDALLEAPMVRALLAEPDRGRLLAGAIDCADEESDDCATRLVALHASNDFAGPPEVLATLDFFVHAVSRHSEDVYVLLARHSGSKWEAPVKVVRLHAAGHSVLVSVQGIHATLPISHGGAIAGLSYAGLMGGVFGVRAGREHAMAVAPDGTLVTGCVDKSSRGILQLWNLEVPDAAAGTGSTETTAAA